LAIYRNFYSKFWSDIVVQKMSKNEKYLFIYLFTNEHTSLCGIYEISIPTISAETKLSQQDVLMALNSLQTKGRIGYDINTGEICIRNWIGYNGTKSPQFLTALRKSFDLVKNKGLIGLLYGLDTPSMGYMTEQNSTDLKPIIVNESTNKELNILEAPLQEQKTLREDKIFKAFSDNNEILYQTLIKFIEMREKKGKPMTEYAKQLLCKRLAVLKNGGQDIIACIDQSILNVWTDIYEVKSSFNYNTQIKESAEEIIERRANAIGQKNGGGY